MSWTFCGGAQKCDRRSEAHEYLQIVCILCRRSRGVVGGCSVPHLYARTSARVWPSLARRLTLPDQEPNANTRHVKPIEPRLDIEPNILRVLFPLPLQHTLCHSRHRRVVSLLDGLEKFRKVLVVLVHFWWPVDTRCFGVVPVYQSQFRLTKMTKVEIAPSVFERPTHLFSIGILSLDRLPPFPFVL